MRHEAFHAWLMAARRNQKRSADSQVSCARSCENHFGVDLDTAVFRGQISPMIEEIEARRGLSRKTAHNHTNALRRYTEFATAPNRG
jgi:hypothetical protein